MSPKRHQTTRSHEKHHRCAVLCFFIVSSYHFIILLLCRIQCVSYLIVMFPPLLVSRGQRVDNQRVGAVGPHQRQQYGAHRSLLRGREKGLDHQSAALRRHWSRGRIRHPHRHPHCKFTHKQAYEKKCNLHVTRIGCVASHGHVGGADMWSGSWGGITSNCQQLFTLRLKPFLAFHRLTLSTFHPCVEYSSYAEL